MPRHTNAIITAELLAQLMPVLPEAALGEWTGQALCTQTDPEIFFPLKGTPGIKARRICAICPVRPECLAYAVVADERFGIWGGLNRAERLRLRQALEVQPAANIALTGVA